MQHFILNNKILELIKNKETALSIPVLFNAGNSEFSLEVFGDQYLPGTMIEFSVFKTALGSGSKKIAIEIQTPVTRFRPSEISELDGGDNLLYSCKTNHSARLALTIVALN